MKKAERRAPILGIGVDAAKRVRRELGYAHPNELSIEALAFLRGVLVRPSPATGARANLLRVGPKGVIGVAATLAPAERRWAIAHELGHFEAHPNVSFVDLCSSEAMVADYAASGREPEANAFAAELLMPEDLARPMADVAHVSWEAVDPIARGFQVSRVAAALRFVEMTDERVCVASVTRGRVTWAGATKDFGTKPERGRAIDAWSLAGTFFRDRQVNAKPETVSASAWIEGASDDMELVEHAMAMPEYDTVVSLLWWRPT